MLTPDLSGDFDQYTTLADAEASFADKRPSIGVRCSSAGTLRVSKAAGGAMADVTFLAGEILWIAIRGIDAAGSVGCAPITIWR
jgi:hypothetical protein